MHSQRRNTNQIPFIDFAKGFAILTIVLMHYGQQMAVTGWWAHLVKLGGTGIHVFFLLSGFGLMLGRYQGWQHFFKRRMSKILLPYYFFLTLMYLLHLLIPQMPSISAYAYLGNLFFIQLFDESIVYVFGIQFWFISTILQGYLLFPLLRLFLQQSRILTFVVVCTLISITYASLLYLTGAHESKLWSRLFFQYLWEFALGMALAKLYQINHYQFWKISFRQAILGTVIGFGLMALFTFGLKTAGTIFNDYPALLGYLCLTIALFKLTQKSGKQTLTGMLWVGKYSYALYLVHIAALSLVLQINLSVNTLTISALTLLFYLSLAFIFTYTFQKVYQLIFIKKYFTKIL